MARGRAGTIDVEPAALARPDAVDADVHLAFAVAADKTDGRRKFASKEDVTQRCVREWQWLQNQGHLHTPVRHRTPAMFHLFMFTLFIFVYVCAFTSGSEDRLTIAPILDFLKIIFLCV